MVYSKATPSAAPESEVHHPRTMADVPPSLLIVDDVEDNRIVLARRFQRRGYRIVEAASGREALDLIAQQSFDTVMLDVMMPEMDGIAVLRCIREQHSASSLPVIMVTARSQSEDVVEALALGANDYVTKPVDFNVALARVNSQIERKRAEEQAQSSAERLRRMNQELEERVSERTANLVAANIRLESEIAQREKSEAHNRYLARHDILTGLGNRLLFNETLTEAFAENTSDERKICVLFVDLDGFKSVNDGLGHAIGDALLRVVATRLRESVREGGRLARLGGDEFAVMMWCDGTVDRPAALACRLIAAIGLPLEIGGNPVHIGASIGIAIEDPQFRTPDDLVKAADMAMYRAKMDGRGVWRLFDPAMDASAQARRLLEIDLRNALSEGELEMFYQPLLDLRTKTITGFEALMRWRHPERGYISPVDFIPVAEDLGLIVPLGEWALREACMEAVKWPPHTRIAVNLSPVQFQRGQIVPSVVNALAASGLAAKRLELEITETVMLEKTSHNLETLQQLRELGVRIAMDDFGTGYSSLSYLRSFPFDKIKIDQSFIRDIGNDDESRAIVQAITSLGMSFGITITAEGVETQEQFDQLSMNGCIEVQGRLFSMPVPAHLVAQLFVDFAYPAVEGSEGI